MLFTFTELHVKGNYQQNIMLSLNDLSNYWFHVIENFRFLLFGQYFKEAITFLGIERAGRFGIDENPVCFAFDKNGIVLARMICIAERLHPRKLDTTLENNLLPANAGRKYFNSMCSDNPCRAGCCRDFSASLAI